jgi:crotonobetainyl-CoA:carnitine CoA-transferase CaiB-like acyl-CoA transferase
MPPVPEFAGTNTQDARRGPLHGVRVLDLSRVLTGPFCSMVLADLGAEVWKVEELRHGDQTRSLPPYVNGESHYYLAINRNKQSLAVDLKTEEGRDIALGLARQADVVLENFRPGVMDRLGLGYDVLRAEKPELIICSITGFGQTGPMADKPSFDLVTQAMSGVMSINGEPDGPPSKLGIPLGDIGGGMWGAVAILSALHHRNATGEGLHIDLSLLDGLIGLLGYLAEIYLVTGDSPGQVGSSHHSIVPYGRFPVKDGHIVLALHTGTFWRNFCRAGGRLDLVEDPRFRTSADRHQNRVALDAIVVEILREKTMAEWHEIFDAGDVPHAPVSTVGEALTQPAVAARGLVRETNHPRSGKVDVVGSPIQFIDRFREASMKAAPMLGQDSRAILADILAYAPEKVDALIAARVIECSEDETPHADKES